MKNLTLHQLRLEFRRGRFELVLYGVILFFNFTVVLGWVGEPKLLARSVWSGGGVLPVLFIIGFWIAFAKIVGGCVLADSPARRDKFLATRPLPARSLLAAKVLYVLLAAVLPAALLEGLSLAAAGAPGELALHGGLERLFFASILALVIAAFAANWATTPSMLLASAICFGGLMLLGNVIAATLRAFAPSLASALREPTFLTALQAALVLALGLALTASLRSRRGLKIRWMTPSFLVIGLAAVLTATKSPLRTAPHRGTQQASLDQPDPARSIRISAGRFSSSMPWQDSTDLNFTCSVQPLATGFPDDWELRWRPIAETWTSHGSTLKHDSPDPNALATQQISPQWGPISWQLADTIQGYLQQQVLFRTERSHTNSSSSLSAGSLRYDPAGLRANQPARLRTHLAADAFRWQIVADLPVEAGASDRGWRLAGVGGINSDFSVHLIKGGLALHTSGSPEHRARSSWRMRNRFVLYLPALKHAWMGSVQQNQPAASLSAAKRAYGTVEFEEEHSGTTLRDPKNLAGARLLILQADYLGRIVTEWESGEVTLHDRPSMRGNPSSPVDRDERINLAEFARWFHQWEKVNPDAEPSAVRSHLDQLLTQADRLDRSLQSPAEPAVIHAARFVPKHLDFLIERLPSLRGPAVNFLISTLTQGAEESQRETIVEAIPNAHTLTKVASDRGWLRPFPASLIALLENEDHLYGPLFGALLASDDPNLDSLTLEIYRRFPSSHRYAMLRQVPRLAEQADRISHELWKPGRIVLGGYAVPPGLQIALQQGRAEALEELFTLIHHHELSGGSNWNLSNLVSSSILLPEDLRKHRHDAQKVMAWATKHAASDFAWDPVFRLFVLNPSRNSI